MDKQIYVKINIYKYRQIDRYIARKKEKNYLNRSINKEIRKLNFCGPESYLRESTISDMESPSNFQVKAKKILKSVQKQRSYDLITMPKLSCLKWTYKVPNS